MDTVLTSGKISHFTHEQFDNAFVARAGCQGTRPADPEKNEGHGTVVFYGELRGANSDECITNRALMNVAPTEFGTELLLRDLNVSEKGEECQVRTRTMRNRTVAEYFCSRGTISCVIKMGAHLPDFRSCRGLLRHGNETYIVRQGAAYPEMDLEPTHARLVRGLDIHNTEWMDGIFISTAPLDDAIHASFAASRERKEVLKTRMVHRTLMSPLWFVALAFKVALVAVLVFTSCWLRCAGFETVANDEQRLAELLHTGLLENVLPGDVVQGEVGIFLYIEEGNGGLCVYADSHPRKVMLATIVKQDEQCRRRNSDLHKLEEMST